MLTRHAKAYSSSRS